MHRTSDITRSILDYLGGAKSLGITPASSALQLHERVASGLPARCVSHFRTHAGWTAAEVSGLLGVSEKTFARWQSTPAKPIDVASSDRLYRTARILALAEDVLEDASAAREWINEPQRGLGNRSPRDLLATDIGTRQVEDLLMRMEHGYLA
jgi:putative toxin-antitoxin system antitoxin component (TIGR02293 family)